MLPFTSRALFVFFILSSSALGYLNTSSVPYTTHRHITNTPSTPSTVLSRAFAHLGTLPSQAQTLNATTPAAFTALYDAAAGPEGFLHFFTVNHTEWIDVFEPKPDGYVPNTAVQITYGNPVVLQGMAHFDIGGLLMAPIRMVIYDDGKDGTNVLWDQGSQFMTTIPVENQSEGQREVLQAFDEKIWRFVQWVAFGVESSVV